MAVALLKFVQGVTIGANGQALVVTAGTSVQVSNSNNTGVASWQLDLLEVPPGSAVSPGDAVAFSEDGSTPTTSFTPTSSVPGCYRWRLKVWGSTNRSGTPDIDIRNVIVKDTRYGWVIPPSMVDPAPLPDTSSNLPGAKPNELNANGQLKGWAGSQNDDGFLNSLIRTIASRHLLADGSNSGQVAVWNGTTFAAAAVNLANSNAVTGLLPATNLAPGADGQVLSTIGGVVAWTAGSSLPDPNGHYTGEYLRVLSPFGAKAALTQAGDSDFVWAVMPSPPQLIKIDRVTRRPVSYHMLNEGSILSPNITYRGAVFTDDFVFIVADDGNTLTRSVVRGEIDPDGLYYIIDTVEVGTRTLRAPDLFSEVLPYANEGSIFAHGDSVYVATAEGVARVDIDAMSFTTIAPSDPASMVTSVAVDPDGDNYTDTNPRVWMLGTVNAGDPEDQGILLDRIELTGNTVDDSTLLAVADPADSVFLGSRVLVGGGFIWVIKDGHNNNTNAQANNIYKINPDTLATVQSVSPTVPLVRFFVDSYYDDVAGTLIVLANNGSSPSTPNSNAQLSLVVYDPADLTDTPQQYTYNDLPVDYEESFLVRVGNEYWVPLRASGWFFTISTSTFVRTDLQVGLHYTYEDADPPQLDMIAVTAISKGGSDVTGNGSFVRPFLTFNYAFEFQGSTTNTFAIAPGDYSSEDPITIDISVSPHTPVPLTFLALGSSTSVTVPELVIDDSQTDISFVRTTIPSITGTGNGVVKLHDSILTSATATGLTVEATNSSVNNAELGTLVMHGGLLNGGILANLSCFGAQLFGELTVSTVCSIRSSDLTALSQINGDATMDAATFQTNPSVVVTGTLTILEDARYELLTP